MPTSTGSRIILAVPDSANRPGLNAPCRYRNLTDPLRISSRCSRPTDSTVQSRALPDVVRARDSEVRAVLPPRCAWYAHLLACGDIDPQPREAGVQRRCRVNEDLHEWLDRVGLPYHSPHKFRHGHATYALKRCKDVADLKAVSQNLMHSSLQLTDSIYSVLSTEDVGQRIAGLGRGQDRAKGSEDRRVSEIVKETLRQLERSHRGHVVT
jgi:hypothetical protein